MNIMTKVAILICMLLAVLGFCWQAFQKEPFESAKWKRSFAEDSQIRLEMVDDLLKRYKLVGMNRKEVDDLLGKPPELDEVIVSAYKVDVGDYLYFLGTTEFLFDKDGFYFHIKFKNDVVTEAKVQ